VGDIPFLHVYARPGKSAERPLEFIAAAESGPEGIACVDDVARAAVLALQTYELTQSESELRAARAWLEFVLYMQEPDGRFVNFIRDRAGRRNRSGRTSYAGGQWWTSRAIWALAAAWRVTGETRYLQAVERGQLAPVQDLKVTAMQALALMELYRACASEKTMSGRIQRWCDRILAQSCDYLRDRAGVATIRCWGYHQLSALARAGRLFRRFDYVAVCERTVQQVIEPLVACGFTASTPWQRAPRCAYDISTIVLGLEDLYRATDKEHYRALAFACADWLFGANPARQALYDPRTGRCCDGFLEDLRTLNVNCGAESAIEAGFVELARHRLAASRHPAVPVPTTAWSAAQTPSHERPSAAGLAGLRPGARS
jgi:hypothetical protein